MSRVCTYLNFDGKTEDAFNFYLSVFGGKFGRGGIIRFEDISNLEGVPTIPNDVKHLIMHVELEILGSHLLMGTDASTSMGFNVKFGNNMHINLMLDNREETNRLFNALSEGGIITADLQNVFWGDYFGSCTDKFGVQWMFTCNEK